MTTLKQLYIGYGNIYNLDANKGDVIRPLFRYKDGDEIYIGAGMYDHMGTVNQSVYWDEELIFHLESTGSNASSDDYGADGWHYIYLDDSAIVTLGSYQLDVTCFRNETTAPTYDHAKRGHYNGLDRCIFAVYETGGVLLEFHHMGNLVLFADGIVDLAETDIDTSWVDVTLTVPAFTRLAQVTNRLDHAGQGSQQMSWWRTNGQTGAVGHRMGSGDTDGQSQQCNTFQAYTDTSQIIEIVHSGDGDQSESIETDGWYFPHGM